MGSLRGINGLSRHILAMKPAAVFHDPLTPLRSDFDFHRPRVFTRAFFCPGKNAGRQAKRVRLWLRAFLEEKQLSAPSEKSEGKSQTQKRNQNQKKAGCAYENFA